jgi:KDO2-lipid IV(A) lauroyltransferase
VVEYIAFWLAHRLLVHLPTSILSWLGILIGVLSYALQPAARRAVYRNLSVVLTTEDRRALRPVVISAFIHGAWSYVEQLALTPSRLAAVREQYGLSGWEHVEEALARGRGAILVSPHLGGGFMAGHVITSRGVPMTTVVEEIRPPKLFDFFKRVRASLGPRLVAADQSAVRHMVTALRRNEALGLFCDRDVRGTGQVLPFFDRPTSVTTAPAALARRTGAVVIPGVAPRAGLYRGAVRLSPPIEVARTDDVESDVREGTLRIMREIESHIRAFPGQWTVFTDLWPPSA